MSNRKGITEFTKAWTLRSKDRAVTENDKKFPGVSEEEDERPGKDEIDDDP